MFLIKYLEIRFKNEKNTLVKNIKYNIFKVNFKVVSFIETCLLFFKYIFIFSIILMAFIYFSFEGIFHIVYQIFKFYMSNLR